MRASAWNCRHTYSVNRELLANRYSETAGTASHYESVNIRMRFLRGPLVALFAFIVGVALTPIQFYIEGRGIGRVIDGGGGFSIASYTSSSAVRLSFVHSEYVSTQKLNEVFEQHVSEAARVIDLTPKLDEHDVVVGRRAVATFFDREVMPACSGQTEGIFIPFVQPHFYMFWNSRNKSSDHGDLASAEFNTCLHQTCHNRSICPRAFTAAL